jgi:hypothetical protein
MADGTPILLAQIGVLIATIVVFGLSLKLYTEILKDDSQNRRGARIDGADDVR